MEKFPKDFCAVKILVDIGKNKTEQFRKDLKAWRRLIFDEFSTASDPFVYIEYYFQSDCSYDDKKFAYRKIKQELEKRGFTIHGSVQDKCVKMLISSSATNVHDKKWKLLMNKIMGRRFSRPSKSSTRTNSPTPSATSDLFDAIVEPRPKRLSKVPDLDLSNVDLSGGSLADEKILDKSHLMDDVDDEDDSTDISDLLDKSLHVDMMKKKKAMDDGITKKYKKKLLKNK